LSKRSFTTSLQQKMSERGKIADSKITKKKGLMCVHLILVQGKNTIVDRQEGAEKIDGA